METVERTRVDQGDLGSATLERMGTSQLNVKDDEAKREELREHVQGPPVGSGVSGPDRIGVVDPNDSLPTRVCAPGCDQARAPPFAAV